MVDSLEGAGPEAEELDRVYRVLSSPARRLILRRLSVAPTSIGELRDGLDFTKQAMTKHVRQLEDAGLVHRSTRGRDHLLTLDRQPIDDAIAWLEVTRSAWTTAFDALEEYLE